ncbi:MAG: hypothetical protein N2C14_24940, partial [Planctomycetales bacterium]
MALFRRRKKPADPPTGPMIIHLPIMEPRIAASALRLENDQVEPLVIRARLADDFRDAQLLPANPKAFDDLTETFDADDWRRFATVVSAFDDAVTRNILPPLQEKHSSVGVVRRLAKLAQDKRRHTMQALRQSELRVEEFARHAAAYLSVPIFGESVEESEEI